MDKILGCGHPLPRSKLGGLVGSNGTFIEREWIFREEMVIDVEVPP